jgi:molecular chaperone GrpE (heat shock protein)
MQRQTIYYFINITSIVHMAISNKNRTHTLDKTQMIRRARKSNSKRELVKILDEFELALNLGSKLSRREVDALKSELSQLMKTIER